MTQTVFHDFVSRTGIWIARPPQVVWPFMRQLGRWKSYSTDPIHVSGRIGEVGEVLLASEGPSRPGSEPERLYLKVLRQDIPRQLVLKLWVENGDDSRGFVDLSLVPSEGGSLFTYSVYVEVRGATRSAVEFAAEVERQREVAQTRFNAENQRLKALVEGGS